MADNYLENKMEEHRRAMSAPRRKTAVAANRKGLAEVLGWNEPSILLRLDTATHAPLAAFVAILRQASCRVSFICTDNTEGSKLAQSTGAMYIPYDDIPRALALLESRRAPADFIIEGDRDSVTFTSDSSARTIRRKAATAPEDFITGAARLCVYLAIPASQALTPSEIEI
ncbi:MAG: hypothetical protein K2L75_03875 [Muribaculaceae bacterium]|nr:hypothetical protein [Muribaculaceae bacterium]MDE6526371.1 hypothetical protein [Muribaculaceae bacterium]MDE6611178.1 hypothetical protein [Muribaculaceae bacterium]